jgi:hypothetical protein
VAKSPSFHHLKGNSLSTPFCSFILRELKSTKGGKEESDAIKECSLINKEMKRQHRELLSPWSIRS